MLANVDESSILRGRSQSLPSLASSSRMGTPPISKITRPVGTLQVVQPMCEKCQTPAQRTVLPRTQTRPYPFPCEFRCPSMSY